MSAVLPIHIQRAFEDLENDIAREFRLVRRRLGLKPVYLLGTRAYTLPHSKFACPYCGGRLDLEIDEWESDSRRPTRGGVAVFCSAYMQAAYDWNPEDPTFDDLDRSHDMGYDPVWLEICRRVERWALRNVEIAR